MKLKLITFLFFILTAFYYQVYSPNDFGLDELNLKEGYLDGIFPKLGTSNWKLDSALSFKATVTNVKRIPNTNKIVGLGKYGSVYLLDYDDPSERKIILDISDKVMKHGDSGLLGIVFHPKFNDSTNIHFREIYLTYTYNFIDHTRFYDRLSKFKFSDDLEKIIESSEEVIIQQIDRASAHIGGDMFFDNEGLLFISYGDGGGQFDTFNNSQKINQAFFGGLLRIDVDLDSTRSHPIRRYPIPQGGIPEGYPDNINQLYMIPNDNPWVNVTGDSLEEFYALGFRSPHRIHYDTTSERIFVADVGQGTKEEVSIISKGSNAQWSYREGNSIPARNNTKPDTIIGIETPPVFDYGRDLGKAVIGGFVYRGNQYPDINGKYIFGDYLSGNIWTLDPENNNEVELLTTVVLSESDGLVSFFVDPNDKINIMLLKGGIFTLEEKKAEEPPSLLSETGAFSDLVNLIPSEGLLPYDVNSPLWSDRAVKKRWVSIPKGTEGINYSKDSIWKFPVGTVFIKHFELPITIDSTAKIETRFLIIDDERNAYGITYKWNEEGTDATLISSGELLNKEYSYYEGGVLQNQTWKFPSRSQCLDCHNKNAGFVLGVKTSQINKKVTYETTGIEDNQINTWDHLGLFSDSLANIEIAALPKLTSINDTSSTLAFRVRSYIDANCSFCHRPGGVEGAFDARESTPLHLQGIVNNTIVSRNSTVDNNIITPLNLATSELWIRDSSLSDNKMPPIGKNLLDTTYLNVLRDWIESLEPYKVTQDINVCNGDEYTLPNGEVISSIYESSTHESTFESQLGIDSIITTNIIYHGLDTMITFDGTKVISNQENANYQWLDFSKENIFIEGANEQSFTPTSSGTFGVVISNDYCSDTSEVQSIVINGIIENNFEFGINVYPNPTSDFVNIDFDMEKISGKINIINMEGKTIKSQHFLSKHNITLDLENEISGLYIIQLEDELGRTAKLRIIKK